MATTDIAYWTGATDGDVQKAGNWAVDSGTPGTPPTSGQGARFDHRAVRGVTDNLSWNPAGGLNLFQVTPGFGDLPIGAEGASLEVDVNNGADAVFQFGGRGKCFINGDTTKAKCEGAAGSKVRFTGGTHTRIEAQDPGRVEVGSSADVTDVRSAGAPVILEKKSTAATSVHAANGGSVDSARNVGEIEVEAKSVVTLQDGALIDTSTGMTGKATVHSMGTFRALSKGTYNNIEVRSEGVLDRVGAEGDADITDSTLWRGAKLRLQTPGVKTNFDGDGGTNASTKIGQLESLMASD